MKKTINFISCLVLLAFTIISCSKDLGNYEYVTLDSLQIIGIEEEYTAYAGKELTIQPDVKNSAQAAIDTSKYSFQWLVYNPAGIGTANQFFPLTNTPDLAMILNLNPGSYRLFYRIHDKKTGEMWEKEAKLKVTTELANGWLILNDINSKSRLDMLNFKTESQQFDRYTDILGTMSDLQPVGKPKFVYYLSNRDLFNSQFTDRIYLGTDQQTYSINNQASTWSNYRNLKEEVFRPTGGAYHAEVVYSQGNAGGFVYILDSDGIFMYENVTQRNYYGPTVNRLNNTGRINVSPFIAPLDGSFSSYAVVYDTDSRRFLVHSGTNKVCLVPKSSDETIVNPGDMKQDLLFMENVLTAGNQHYALLQDPKSKQIKLYRFVASSATFSPLAYENVANTHNIDIADFYATDPTYGYIIYSVGSKVYIYDPFRKIYKTILDLGNRKISLLKFQRMLRNKTAQRYMEYAKQLMVCTFDETAPETSGKMEFYNINLNGDANLATSYDGFGKIVSVSYRE